MKLQRPMLGSTAPLPKNSDLPPPAQLGIPEPERGARDQEGQPFSENADTRRSVLTPLALLRPPLPSRADESQPNGDGDAVLFPTGAEIVAALVREVAPLDGLVSVDLRQVEFSRKVRENLSCAPAPDAPPQFLVFLSSGRDKSSWQKQLSSATNWDASSPLTILLLNTRKKQISKIVSVGKLMWKAKTNRYRMRMKQYIYIYILPVQKFFTYTCAIFEADS